MKLNIRVKRAKMKLLVGLTVFLLSRSRGYFEGTLTDRHLLWIYSRMPMSWSVHGLSDTLLIPLIQSDPQTIYRNDFGDPMTFLCFTEHHGFSLLNPNTTKMILYFSSINSFVLHCFKLCIYKTQSFFWQTFHHLTGVSTLNTWLSIPWRWVISWLFPIFLPPLICLYLWHAASSWLDKE